MSQSQDIVSGGKAQRALTLTNLIALIILCIQSLLLSALAILESGNMTFRFLGICVGLGLVLVPIIFKGVEELERKNNRVSSVAALLSIVFLIFSPWIRLQWLLAIPRLGLAFVLSYHLDNAAELAAAAGIYPLVAACLGFSFLGFFGVFKEVDNVDKPGAKIIMRALRLLLGVVFLGLGIYIISPLLPASIKSVTMAWLLMPSGDKLASLIVSSMGRDPLWFPLVLIDASLCFLFYKNWLFPKKGK